MDMTFLSLSRVLLVSVLVILTGCQTVDTVIGGAETVYSCVDASTLAIRPGPGRHHLDVTYTYAGQVVYRDVLQSVSSDFGERFRADDGTSFWLNEEKGLFSRPGESLILCHLGA